MAQHNQNDFIIPILLYLRDHGGIASMSEIKGGLSEYITMSEEDLQPYGSRREYEPRYRQIAGNLVCHKNTTLFKYIAKSEVKGKYRLTDAGSAFLETLNETVLADISQTLATGFPAEGFITNTSISDGNSQLQIDPLDQKLIDRILQGRRPVVRSRSIRDEVVILNDYRCQYGIWTGSRNHISPQDIKNKIVEGHHLIPLENAPQFAPKNLDRPSNIICLCPNCHARLHNGTPGEKRAMLNVIYEHQIDILDDDELFVSFDRLCRYYGCEK